MTAVLWNLFWVGVGMLWLDYIYALVPSAPAAPSVSEPWPNDWHLSESGEREREREKEGERGRRERKRDLRACILLTVGTNAI